MSIVSKSIMFLAAIVSFLGFFYLGVSQGQGMDAKELENKDTNYKGGIAGIIIGLIVFVIGGYISMKSS